MTDPPLFLDANVVVYAFDQSEERSQRARELLDRGAVVSVQVLNEFANAARRKLGFAWPEVIEASATIRVLVTRVVPLTIEIHEHALRVAQRFGYRIWDASIVATALEVGCRTLYTEDLQDGRKIEGLTIRNPFR